MPSDVPTGVSVFDRFASQVSSFVSRACPARGSSCSVLLVLLWAPSIFLLPDVGTWQLVINTVTTIVTFLLVALLQNTQKRADEAAWGCAEPPHAWLRRSTIGLMTFRAILAWSMFIASMVAEPVCMLLWYYNKISEKQMVGVTLLLSLLAL